MDNTIKNKYTTTFSAGSLLFNEFNSVLDILRESDIRKERKRIISENLFKLNSENARERVYHEVSKRSDQVDRKFWEFYSECENAERKALLFYVILKSHPIFFDFQTEVVLERFRSLNLCLTKDDIEIFLTKKSADHPEIDSWSNTTREKIKGSLLLIITQAGLLKDSRITPLSLSESFWREFLNYGEEWFLELALLNKSERENILGAKHEIS